jgi:hypothetical protein
MGARFFQQIEKLVINEIVSGLAPEGDVRAFGNDFLQKLNEPFAGKGEVGICKPEVAYSPGLQMFDFGNDPVNGMKPYLFIAGAGGVTECAGRCAAPRGEENNAALAGSINDLFQIGGGQKVKVFH